VCCCVCTAAHLRAHAASAVGFTHARALLLLSLLAVCCAAAFVQVLIFLRTLLVPGKQPADTLKDKARMQVRTCLFSRQCKPYKAVQAVHAKLAAHAGQVTLCPICNSYLFLLSWHTLNARTVSTPARRQSRWRVGCTSCWRPPRRVGVSLPRQ
jgi:hypothetical protein